MEKNRAFYGWSAPIFRTLVLLHLREIGLFIEILFESWCIRSIRSNHHYKFEQRKLKKIEDFRIDHVRLIRRSAPNIFDIFLRILIVTWKGSNTGCFNCWVFIFTEEKSCRKFRRLKAEKFVVLISTFEKQIWRMSPKSRTLLLVHLKGIRLCCNISLGSRCICFIKSIHRNKFGQRKSRKFKIFCFVHFSLIRWSAFTFFQIFLLDFYITVGTSYLT